MSNVEFGSPSPKVSVETSYRGIGKSHMVLQKSAMKELRRYLSFTQLRFHCRKKQGRTFHVVTASNSSGEAKIHFLYVGWHTRLLRFHGEQPYRARVES